MVIITSKVYFSDLKADTKEGNLPNKIVKLFKETGFPNSLESKDLIAIKMHFGEQGNTAFVRPILVRGIVDEIHTAGQAEITKG